MKNTFRVLFYLKKSKLTKDGYPVMCRVSVSGTSAAFSCQLKVMPSEWSRHANRPQSRAIAARLKQIEKRIKRHYQLVWERDTLITARKVLDSYFGFDVSCKTLMEAYDYHIECIRERIGIDRKQRTYDKLVGEKNSIIRFLNARYSERILLLDLNSAFIRSYYIWLQSGGKCGQSTAFHRTQTLKSVLYTAVEKGWIDRHPFLSFKCKPNYKPRCFLSDGEIQKIMNVQLRYHRQRAVRDMSLFCCFTGVAYADLKALTYDDIITSEDFHYILGRREKTNAGYRIQLLPFARLLIDRYRGYPGKIDANRLFPVKNRESMTTTIKRIAAKCGIKKNISTHQARHTFACVAIEYGMPIDVLAKILGHTNVNMTRHYAKISEANISREMMKIGEAFQSVG